jgi:hypothetical protein
MNGIMYDPMRKLTKMQQVSASSAGTQYTPSPWNLDVDIYVISKTLDDNFQIMEQIIPYFSPELSLNINLYPGQESESVPIVMNGVTTDIPIDIAENDDRLYVTNFNFTVKANYYPKKSITPAQSFTCIAPSGSSTITTNTSDFLLAGATQGTLVSGTGIVPGTFVVSVSSSGVTLSQPTTVAVSGSNLLFKGGNVTSGNIITGCSVSGGNNYISIPYYAASAHTSTACTHTPCLCFQPGQKQGRVRAHITNKDVANHRHTAFFLLFKQTVHMRAAASTQDLCP